MRDQRRVHVGAVAQVEHVTGEHNRRGPPAFIDRPGHAATDLTRDVGRGVREAQVAEHQCAGAPRHRHHELVGRDPPPSGQLDELAVGSSPVGLLGCDGHWFDRNPTCSGQRTGFRQRAGRARCAGFMLGSEPRPRRYSPSAPPSRAASRRMPAARTGTRAGRRAARRDASRILRSLPARRAARLRGA